MVLQHVRNKVVKFFNPARSQGVVVGVETEWQLKFFRMMIRVILPHGNNELSLAERSTKQPNLFCGLAVAR